MKHFFVGIILSAVTFATQAQTTQNWCIWEGEEYLKKSVLEDGQFWMRAVYDLHQQGSDLSGKDFTGIGSCRFIPRSLGKNVDMAITAYLEKGITIIPSRAYMQKSGDNIKFVLPQAQYLAGTNELLVYKDFYSLDPMVCHDQKEEMIELGKNTTGLRIEDVVVKKHEYGGVSAVLFENNAQESSYYGVCHFSSVQE